MSVDTPPAPTQRPGRTRRTLLRMTSALPLLSSSLPATGQPATGHRAPAQAPAPAVPAADRHTLRLAEQADVLSLDPHALNEAVQMSFLSNIYEPLVTFDTQFQLMPCLAERWTQLESGAWRFHLRSGVRFHDGSPLRAEDVVFSIQRSRDPASDLRSFTSAVKALRVVDELTVDVVTSAPVPTLPESLTRIMMMSREWTTARGASRPADRRREVDNATAREANGTGPFRLIERNPGQFTTVGRHTGYWAPVDSNVIRLEFIPITKPQERVAALLSGSADLIMPVPVEDFRRLRRAGFRIVDEPELRTIFLGMDQRSPELPGSNVQGRNPFADRRVRQAVYQAIDIDWIRLNVMAGQSVPAALLAGPGVRGFPDDLNTRLPFDPDAARRLLRLAGYPGGFSVPLDCPNNRYVRDAAICEAVARMLGEVGIRVQLRIRPKDQWFHTILSRASPFYLLGWSPASADSLNVIEPLLATPTPGGQGQYNLGHYSNPRIDELVPAISSAAPGGGRNRLIREAFALHREDIGHIPLHQQRLAIAMRGDVHCEVRADGHIAFSSIRVG